MNLRDRYDAATAGIEAPFAAVDLAALRANAAALARRAAGKPIRVASKSVRCRALLEDVLAMDGFAGIMAYTLPEALWLAREGVSDDILVAYPTTDRTALADLAADPTAASAITLMTDAPEHLDLIEHNARNHPIRVCIDIDASYRPLGGRIRIGALRSPLHTPAQVTAFAEHILRRPSLHLAGLMAYESQIAGVGDVPPGRPARGRAIRAMQRRSRIELARRRAAIVRSVRELTDLE
ncbi:MAG: alanine racemase, partial [Spirillospora sp.]